MGRVVEKEGYKYSIEPFEGYKFRAKFVSEKSNGEQIINTDVYTTNPDRNAVEKVLAESAKKNLGPEPSKVIHWASKEQDDLTSKLLTEFLNE